jgi:micrococcal nuclease
VVDEDRIRLIGIDAPETNAPGQPVECFGREASARLRGLLPAGTVVRLELDPTNGTRPDQFGRGLAYVHRESDGLFLNLVLVREGFAVAYPYGETRQYRRELAAAEAEARAARRGLWGICRVRGG